MKLFFRELGQGQPFIILHGLMGSSDNWLTQAKLLADQYHIYMIDQRNHGQSEHSNEFDYKVLATDLKDFIANHKLEKPIVLGHSMGGKAAMNFAISNPDMLDRLIVVDIAPKAYPVHHDSIVEGLKAVPINTLESRNQADEVLSQFVPEKDVRQFLLKNLSRKPEGGFAWKINLPVIDKNLELISADLQFKGTFSRPTLFVRGVNSNYVKDEDRPRIKELFPNSTLITMDTGHWVQAEKPQEFVEVVEKFFDKHEVMSQKGKLFLIPTVIAEGTQEAVIPSSLKKELVHIHHFLAEDVRTARRFLSSLKIYDSIEPLQFSVLNKDTKEAELTEFFSPVMEGKDLGVLSESGCPGVADPGALAAKFAHRNGITVVPLVGPSSILLSLMASGLNGQQFAFQGYLPIEGKESIDAIRKFEKESKSNNQTQIFIETPYRNNPVTANLLKALHPETLLCIAVDITGPQESIQMRPVKEWKLKSIELPKLPAVFLFLAQ